ncbi:MAG: histidine kinase dimerization/phosphoacceptor domain -containing protein [Terricaulis sp.]
MALLLGLAMLPAGAIAMQVGLNAVGAHQSAYEESLGRRALQSLSAERNTIDEVREMLRVLAAAPSLQEIQTGDCRKWLGDVIVRYPYLTTIGVTDNAGAVECSVPTVRRGFTSPQTSVRDRAKQRDGFTIGYVPIGSITHAPILAAMEPIRDQNGVRIGFVGASIRITTLEEMLNQNRTLEGARAALVDYSGAVVAQSASPAGGYKVDLPDAVQIVRALHRDPTFIQVDNGGAVVAPLSSRDLYAVMVWPDQQPTLQRTWGVAASLAAPLLIWMLAVAAGWFAIEVFVARPLSTLEAAARGYARGEDVPEAAELAGAPDEIRSLRRTLAAMAKTLRSREQRLVAALAEERALLREVNHRVKNNLQMVASLLNIQARGATDEGEAWGLARAHDRVQLLALVHQRIYSSGELRELRLDDLVAEIARQLLQSRGASARGVKLGYDIDAVREDVDRAMPLAFMVGEAISAALDTLNGVEDAELRLWLREGEDGTVRFAISTTFAGPTSAAPSARLIDAFARQVGAEVGRSPNRPAELWVSVPPAASADAAKAASL